MSIGENAMLNKLTYLLSYQIIAASKLDACILQCLSPLSGPSLAKVNACGNPFLLKINTKKPVSREVCKDDTAPTVKVQNVEELHALQKKKASAPTTPRNATNPSTPKNMTPRSYLSEEERQKQQMQSIR